MAPYLGELATAGIVRTNKIQPSFTELLYTIGNGCSDIFEDLVAFQKFLFLSIPRYITKKFNSAVQYVS